MKEKLFNKIYNILHWSEKYTRTDMVYLFRGGIWLFLGQIISSLSVFLLAIAFANLLPKETYGTYRYVLSMAGILGVFSLTGMGTAITRAVARGFEGILKKAFWIQMKWGLIMFFASLAVGIYYFLNGNRTLAVCFLIVGSFSPLLNSANTFSSFLNGKKDFKRITQYNILSVIFSSLALLTTVLITKRPFFLILTYFVASAITNVFFYIKTLRVFKPNKEQDPETISYGKHLSLMNIITTIANYLDGPLVFHFLGAASLAVYSLAIAPPEQIKALFKNIGGLALPKFSENTKEEIKKTIFRKMFIFGLVISSAVLLYIIFAPLAYKIFFPKYLESVFYSQIYALSIIAIVIYLPFSAMEGQMATKQLYFLNFWSSLVQIILLTVFIFFWGIWGAIASRVISRFLNLFFSVWLLKKF
ncbi:MAG: polysaccharide biosynthesis protein [Parcubacteria group bacterium Athens0714_24]|nr:MAG: polysaccharide biosynthesis protein [Parcubacteria group bacterium Athens0714_24]